MSAAMTKGEREDLQRLIRQREKVQKSAAKQRSAVLLRWPPVGERRPVLF